MIDLNKATSLNLRFDDKKNLLLTGTKLEPKSVTPLIRRISDLKDVLIDHQWYQKADPDKTAYLIFRDIHNYMDQNVLLANDLRYDIIVLFPAMNGKEYNKTLGHENSKVTGTLYTYSELHQVLHGEALFLLQKTEDGKIADAYFINAKKGEIVLVPPNYSRCIVNQSKEIAIIASWNARSNLAHSEKIIERRGMCQYFVEGKTIANENYKEVPKELIFNKTTDPKKFKLSEGQPIYRLIDNPKSLEFLTKPQEHKDIFERD